MLCTKYYRICRMQRRHLHSGGTAVPVDYPIVPSEDVWCMGVKV